MKIVIASNGKKTVKMSKIEWQSIGKKAGWTKEAQNFADGWLPGRGGDLAEKRHRRYIEDESIRDNNERYNENKPITSHNSNHYYIMVGDQYVVISGDGEIDLTSDQLSFTKIRNEGVARAIEKNCKAIGYKDVKVMSGI